MKPAAAGAVPVRLLSIRQAAEALSVSPKTVHELIGRRELASLRVGRVRRIPLDVLENYINDRLTLGRGGEVSQ